MSVPISHDQCSALLRSIPAMSFMPVNDVRVSIAEIGGRTRMTIQSIFPDASAMEQLTAMGMEEGLKQSVGQIDAILAEDAAART